MTMEDGVHNARIATTFLGVEDHGFFIAQLEMDYGGARQAFRRILPKEGAYKVLRDILVAVGVDSWEQLRGKNCRVAIDGGFIRQVGNIINNSWTELPSERGGTAG